MLLFQDVGCFQLNVGLTLPLWKHLETSGDELTFSALERQNKQPELVEEAAREGDGDGGKGSGREDVSLWDRRGGEALQRIRGRKAQMFRSPRHVGGSGSSLPV